MVSWSVGWEKQSKVKTTKSNPLSNRFKIIKAFIRVKKGRDKQMPAAIKKEDPEQSMQEMKSHLEFVEQLINREIEG